MIREKIKYELEKLSDFDKKERLKSFVFFNVSDKKELEIRETISEEFTRIEEYLKGQRSEECSELLKQIDWVDEKYFNLMDRYENTTAIYDIHEWAGDAYKHEYERVMSIPAQLSKVTTDLYLRPIAITQFFKDKKQLDILNKTLDFRNLYLYHHDQYFAQRYTRTDEEKKYDDLNASINSTNRAKYIYCYNIDMKANLDDFEKLFSGIFKWNYLYWSVFCLSTSQSEFESITSEFLKTELYYNRLLIDVTVYG